VTRSRLPGEVQRLLESGLDSIEKLEALRYLRRARGPVTRTELMRVLRLEREAVELLIAELSRAQLVEVFGEGGHLRPGAAALDAAYDALIRLYDEDRPLVVAAQSALAMERIRTMAVRTFGEALVSKKKPSKGGLDS
jgi:DNA-binding IclR family transcriptional regulator